MEKERVINEIIDAMKSIDKFKDVDIKSQMTFKELGVNSLNFIKLITLLEDNLNIEFDEDQLDRDSLATVDQLATCIMSLLTNK